MAAKNKPYELTLTRIYDAPVKAVWDAWTDPKQAAHWWGPRGFTITTKSKDLRPGGSWVYTMHGPDGTDYLNVTKYHEVEKYSRLVYDHGGNENQPPMFQVTVTFKETNGKTKMDMTMTLPSAEKLEETRKVIKNANGNSTWDRLDEYLNKESTGKERFVIHKTFQASIETMFEMWTNPEHFTQWLPPTGFTMKFERPAEIKAGSQTFYSMSNDSGMKMYGKINYIEIRKPDLLKYTQEFADEKGNTSRHPMSPTWPELMLTTITMVQEDAEHTRLRVQWEPFGKFSAEELATFVQQKAGMTQGWTGSFDKLENYLSK